MKIAVVYWSGTGNTEAMANAVLEGANAAGGEGDLLTAAEFTADQVGEYGAIAFGCPSMGVEELPEHSDSYSKDGRLKEVYNLCGQRLPHLTKGINIVHNPDGFAQIIYIK